MGLANVVLLAAAVAGPPADLHCLHYDVPVELHGTLIRMAYPRPPKFVSTHPPDGQEEAWVLMLAPKICVFGSGKGDDTYRLEDQTSIDAAIQVTLTPAQYSRFRSLPGTRVTAHGVLLGVVSDGVFRPVLDLGEFGAFDGSLTADPVHN